MDPFKLIKTKKIFSVGEAYLYQMKKNGLKVIIFPNKKAPVVTFQIWYKVGSKNEVKNKTGLAHMFEHMMFRGTKKYPAGSFDQILDNAGSEGSNAFTSSDYTAYIESLPSQSIELPIKLEADRMVNININQETLDIERDSVLNERSLRVDNDPSGKAWEILLNNSFENHPYKNETIGFKRDIKNLTLDDCYNFYKKYYAPNNAIVVVVGDISKDYILNLVEHYFGDIDSSNITYPDFIFDQKRDKEVKIVQSFDTNMTRVIMGFNTPSYSHPDYLPLKLLSTILTGSRSSILKKELLYTNKVLSIYSSLLAMEHPSLFTIEMKLKPDNSYDNLIKIVENLIIKLLTSLQSEDLKIAKNQLIMEISSIFISNDTTALSLGESAILTGDPFYEYNLLESIKKITVEDIKKVILNYLKPKNRITVILKPE